MKRSLKLRLFVAFLLLITIQALLIGGLHSIGMSIIIAIIAASVVTIIIMLSYLKSFVEPFSQMVEALEVGVRSLKDNDFSVTIQNKHYQEFDFLIDTYNELTNVLRHERLSIFQREQLLNKVIQATPVALILTDNNGRIVLSNYAAKNLLNYQAKLDGELFHQAIEGIPQGLYEATINRKDGLVTESLNNEAICYSLTCQQVTLANKMHHLYLYKNLTSDISRKENDIWKKAIRLISHELNNSLAPIKSLTSSAKKIIEQPKHHQMLPDIFDTIGNRVENLHLFLSQYATYARLPAPQFKTVELASFIESIERLSQIKVNVDVNESTIVIDQAQIEQALLNLIKNAKESGSAIADIELTITQLNQQLMVTLVDGGSGMSQTQLQQALLPFFTTKPTGSGLGLALCNEIIIAHNGKLKLANRRDAQGETISGIEVQFSLPLQQL